MIAAVPTPIPYLLAVLNVAEEQAEISKSNEEDVSRLFSSSLLDSKNLNQLENS